VYPACSPNSKKARVAGMECVCVRGGEIAVMEGLVGPWRLCFLLELKNHWRILIMEAHGWGFRRISLADGVRLLAGDQRWNWQTGQEATVVMPRTVRGGLDQGGGSEQFATGCQMSEKGLETGDVELEAPQTYSASIGGT
jgi:hypothetical protein